MVKRKSNISVVIPTYNRSKLLLRAVKSALKQTYPIYEILVCDDGSTDDSKEKVELLINDKVKWIDGRHSGLPAVPRNIGIKKARGDWIAFLDSDDEWKKDKIERQKECLSTSDCSLVYTDAIYKKKLFLSKKQSETTKPYTGMVYKNLLRSNFILNSSVMVKRDVLVKLHGFDEDKRLRGVEDYELWLRLARDYKFCYVDKPLVVYNQKGTRLSENYKEILKGLIFIYKKNISHVSGDDEVYLKERIEIVKKEIKDL